jgi:NAD(P)-dependent dehydrogenase (short-subunit alcohol dehydrogenase family)
MINYSGIFIMSIQVIFITGCSGEIGGTIAKAFSSEKFHLALCARNFSPVEEVAREVRQLGGNATPISLDVRRRNEVEGAVETIINAFGKIDVLINAAGIGGGGPSETFSESDWDDIVDTNLKGTFLCAQAVGKYMLSRKSGKIINISSVAGLGAFPQRAAYCPSKAAVISLTKVLAIEWANRNVQVNAIAPGVIRSKMNENMIARGLLDLNAIERRTPMGRRGEASELVGAIKFLCSDEASYITGTTITIDGGWDAYSFL